MSIITQRAAGFTAFCLGIAVLLTTAACDPTSGSPPIFLTLRWCVMEGSSEADGISPGDIVTTYRADGDALARANEVWGTTNVGFVSTVAQSGTTKGVPVIGDPDNYQSSGEGIGDIDAPGGDPFESLQAAFACHRAWRRANSEAKGPVVVTVRRFGHAGLTLAGSSQPAFALWAKGAHPLGGGRGDDSCGEPRDLLPEDVFEIDGSSATHIDVGWLVIAQPDQFRNLDQRSRALAHELGHVLFLGHGNGLDDNRDGEEAGVPGPRRYDQYCDPLGSTVVDEQEIPREDLDSTPNCGSLMGPTAGCSLITELQVEQARATASVMPGCSGSPCKH